MGRPLRSLIVIFERIDAEVMVDRGEEVAGPHARSTTSSPRLSRRADDAAGLDAAAGPDVRECARPVIAAGLHRAGGSAGVARAGAAVEADLRRAAKLAGDDHEHALVESARVDVFDERGHRAVVGRHAEAQGLEQVLVHRVIVPVAAPARTAARSGCW